MRRAGIVFLSMAMAGCTDAVGPRGLDVPALANLGGTAGATSCPATATFVVADEASLRAAVQAAQPGDVIAIQGMIQLTEGVGVTTADVTLTCATLGSGLAFAFQRPPNPSVTVENALIGAQADRIVVHDLVLDASLGTTSVFGLNADGQRTERNTITCGSVCGFWHGTTNAIVSDNHATHRGGGGGGSSGLHFQVTIDGTHIERNTVTALAPVASGNFGGIRPRDGAGVVVADNVVRGPWTNSISSVNLNGSELIRNILEDAQRHGLTVNIAGSVDVAFSRANTASGNRVSDAGISGFLLRNACNNQFRGNPTFGATPHAFKLTETTGANLVVGTAGTSIDDGNYDCDGDGVADPNKVSGKVVRSASTSASASAATYSQSPSIDSAQTPTEFLQLR